MRRAVSAGERILEFRGTVVGFGDTLRLGADECYTLQVAAGVYLDLEPPGRFVNHSCQPNAGIRDAVHLVALRDLAPGEELLFDYSTTMDEDSWTMECRCGTDSCRGTIGDFKYLPTARKRELILWGVVPAFIVAREVESGRLTIPDDLLPHLVHPAV